MINVQLISRESISRVSVVDLVTVLVVERSFMMMLHLLVSDNGASPRFMMMLHPLCSSPIRMAHLARKYDANVLHNKNMLHTHQVETTI
jgi:hypothetical protein